MAQPLYLFVSQSDAQFNALVRKFGDLNTKPGVIVGQRDLDFPPTQNNVVVVLQIGDFHLFEIKQTGSSFDLYLIAARLPPAQGLVARIAFDVPVKRFAPAVGPVALNRRSKIGRQIFDLLERQGVLAMANVNYVPTNLSRLPFFVAALPPTSFERNSYPTRTLQKTVVFLDPDRNQAPPTVEQFKASLRTGTVPIPSDALAILVVEGDRVRSGQPMLAAFAVVSLDPFQMREVASAAFTAYDPVGDDVYVVQFLQRTTAPVLLSRSREAVAAKKQVQDFFRPLAARAAFQFNWDLS